MTPPDETASSIPSGEKGGKSNQGPQLSVKFGWAVLVLIACFGRPLYDLGRFAVHSTLYSHIVLVPFISLYLVWIRRHSLPAPMGPDRGAALAFLSTGALGIGGYWIASSPAAGLAEDDALATITISFLLLFIGVCGWFLGRPMLRALAFPLGFLVFMVPFPTGMRIWLESWLQHGSAVAALALFKLSGTTVFSDDLIIKLPGISLEVAPECSGIHSSLALFVTSTIAGYFFLRTTWKRTVLVLAVIPLAILRNGLRIFTIGELCVHFGPDMINSYIHKKGGPVFFALSLIPLLLLLRFLFNSDKLGKNAKNEPLSS